MSSDFDQTKIPNPVTSTDLHFLDAESKCRKDQVINGTEC